MKIIIAKIPEAYKVSTGETLIEYHDKSGLSEESRRLLDCLKYGKISVDIIPPPIGSGERSIGYFILVRDLTC